MQNFGLAAYLIACGAAFILVRKPLSASVARRVAIGFVSLVALPLTALWIATDGAGSFLGMRGSQVSVVLLHGLIIAFLPSGIFRPLSAHKWAASLALLLALCLPFIFHGLFVQLGDTRSRYSEGYGRLGDLIFLDPVALGVGVTRAGEVTFRHRVHHLALLGLVMLSLLPHLVPRRSTMLSDSVDPDQPR